MRSITQAIEDLGINRTQFYQLMEELKIQTEDQGKIKLIDEENFQKLYEVAEKKFISSKLRRYEYKIRECEEALENSKRTCAELKKDFAKKIERLSDEFKFRELEYERKVETFKNAEQQIISKYEQSEQKLLVSLKQKEELQQEILKLKEENLKHQFNKENSNNSYPDLNFLKEQLNYLQEENKRLTNQLIKSEHLNNDLENKKVILEKVLEMTEKNLEQAQEDKEKLFHIINTQSRYEDSSGKEDIDNL